MPKPVFWSQAEYKIVFFDLFSGVKLSVRSFCFICIFNEILQVLKQDLQVSSVVSFRD